MATEWPKRFAVELFSSVASAAYWVGVLGLLEAATLFDYSRGSEPDEAPVTAKLAGVLVLAPLLYALLLRTTVPTRGLRHWLGLIAFAVLAGLYWLASTFVFYGLTAGDRRDGPTGLRGPERIDAILFVLAAIAIFALLLRAVRTIMSGRTERALRPAPAVQESHEGAGQAEPVSFTVGCDARRILGR